MKKVKTFTLILILVGIISFGQENKFDEINNKIILVDLDSTLTKLEFKLNESDSIVLRVWSNNKRIFKIERQINVDYGEIKSTIYLDEDKPIKIIESEQVYYFLPDSIAQIKGYGIDLKEEFRAVSYITNWNTKDRELIIGKPTDEKNILYELSKYDGIVRKAKNLIKK